MFKKLNKVTLTINIVAIIAILFDVINILSSPDVSLFGTGYLFGIYFLVLIYIITFIHLFFYVNLKDKLKVATLDLFPVILFSILLTVIDETNFIVIARDVVYFILLLYVVGGLLILLLNFIIHKIYSKFKIKK